MTEPKTFIIFGGSNEGEGAERPSHSGMYFEGLYHSATPPRFVTWMRGRERGEWVSFQPVIDSAKDFTRRKTIAEIMDKFPHCFTTEDEQELRRMMDE